MNADTVNGRLLIARKRALMTQQDVAEKLGKSRVSVCNLENGKRKAKVDETRTLAEIYGVRLRWLLVGEGEPAFWGNVAPRQKPFAPGGGLEEECRIIDEVMAELRAARARYPWWPTDMIHATVVMVEEATEALKAANEVVWSHKGTLPTEVRGEVIQTMAMCLRLLVETPGLEKEF